MSIYFGCCPYFGDGQECKEDCKFAVGGKCVYEEKKECPFGYEVPEHCSECEYIINGSCIFKKLNKISRELQELFPGLKCYVTDEGGLCIQASIVNNTSDSRIPHSFENALNVIVNPLLFGTGAAYVGAEVMLVEDGPACHYDFGTIRPDGSTVWEQEFPDQRFMINPECVLWGCEPCQKNKK